MTTSIFDFLVKSIFDCVKHLFLMVFRILRIEISSLESFESKFMTRNF